jgi:hypothetical protein
MDRAHRLGQQKVVNVYRLITRGTLEEKIMGLQRFKLSIANTVVNAENASLDSMNTGQLLDLFSVSKAPKKVGGRERWALVWSATESEEIRNVMNEKGRVPSRAEGKEGGLM